MEYALRKGIRRLSLLLAVLMLLSVTGCGIFTTKMAMAVQKMSKLQNFHVEAQVSAELALCLDAAQEENAAADQARRELPLQGSWTGSGEWYTDPFRLYLDTELSLPGTSSKTRIYGEKDDGAYYFYSLLGDGSIWKKQGLAEWGKAKVNGVKYLVEGAGFFTEAGTETVDGFTAMRYDGVFPGEFLAGLFTLYHVRELLTDGLGLEVAEGVLEEPSEIPASIWLDTHSGLIVRLDADLGAFARSAADKQLSAARDALGLDALGLSPELREMHVSVHFSDFDSAEAFQIPDEAKAAWGESVKPWEQ